MKGNTIALFYLIFTQGFCQVLPPGFELNMEEEVTSIASQHEDYDFVSLVFDKNIGFEPEHYFTIKNDEGAYTYASTFAGQHRPFGPWSITKNNIWIGFFEKVNAGQLVSLIIREKRTGKIMALFLRSKSKIEHSQLIKLNNIQFKEGNFFFDYCTTYRKYTLPYSLNDRITFNKGKYAGDKVIDINRYTIRVKKLNKILKKTGCSKYL